MDKENSTNSNFDDWRRDPRSSSSHHQKKKGLLLLSKGISPERFHNHESANRCRRRKQQQQNGHAANDDHTIMIRMNQLKETIQSSLIQQGKRRIGHEQLLRREAYKQMTECKSWPLQEPALEHFHHLLQQHKKQQQQRHDSIIKENEAAQNNRRINPYSKQQQHHNNNINNKGSQVTHAPTHRVSSQPHYVHSGISASSSLSSASCSDLSSQDYNEPKRLLRTLHSSPAKSRYKELCREEFRREQAIPMGLELPMSLSNPTNEEEMGQANNKNNNNQEGGIEEQQQNDCEFLLNRPSLWSMEPCIWAWEISATGKRKYVVGQLGRCMDLYWYKTLAENRHGYELIREGIPCRLYLDIEYSKLHNPHLSYHEASTTFLTALFHDLARQLQDKFPTHFPHGRNGDGDSSTTLQRRHIVDLDSSTDKKYSRHWIVHLPGQYLFSSNHAVGRFVHEWIGSLIQKHQAHHQQHASQRQGGQEQQQQNTDSSSNLDPAIAKYLMVNTKSNDKNISNDGEGGSPPPPPPPPQTCIVDLGVYTKNRLFRLLGSCKYGKPASAALRIAQENEFPFPPNFGNDNFYKKKGSNSSTTTTIVPTPTFERRRTIQVVAKMVPNWFSIIISRSSIVWWREEEEK